MIYLELFLVFLKIGAVSFGGGYGMISLIREECLSRGFLTENELLDFIAVSESTPGPIAVNIATFVGAAQGGFAGSLVATLGVVLPSFLIILFIAAIFKNLLQLAGVKATLTGVRPAIVGMVLATAAILCLNTIFSISNIRDGLAFEGKNFALMILLFAILFLYQKIRKKSAPPILLLLFSGIMGIVLF